MVEKRLENLPDETLVLAAMLGDLRSFDVLALRYRSAAYRVAQVVAGNELAEPYRNSFKLFSAIAIRARAPKGNLYIVRAPST